MPDGRQQVGRGRRLPSLPGVNLSFDAVRRIGRDQLSPIAAGGPVGRVNRSLVEALATSGVMGEIFPDDLGGSNRGGVSATDLCRVREALAMESTEAETALAVQGLGSYPILLAGNDDQMERWIPPIAQGEMVTAFALTEARGGSDAGHLELSAERSNDGWILNGEKRWISNAPDADLITMFARTTPEAGSRGITAFIVSADEDGVGGKHLNLLSPHPVGTVQLDNVFVDASRVVGDVDGGFAVAMRTLDLFRPSVGAFAVGMAQAALDAAVEYAASREAFGKPIGDFQGVAHRLADMVTETEAARMLVYAAAKAYDDGRTDEITQRSAMAKLFATETAQRVVDGAIQIHGAVALEEGHLLEHLYREVRTPRIYEGTSEIQRNVIARELRRRTAQDQG